MSDAEVAVQGWCLLASMFPLGLLVHMFVGRAVAAIYRVAHG